MKALKIYNLIMLGILIGMGLLSWLEFLCK